jgi:hypothetical protein
VPPMTPERGLALVEGRSVTLRQGASTPLRGVMRDVRWLSLYVREESTVVDATLREYFAACDPDVTASVTARIQNLPAELMEGVDAELAENAVKLYLKSLRYILQREEDRLGRKNFSNILQDDSMHRAFLAICFEIVVHTHKRHALPFPAIPTAFKVCAFEFYIMTDNFLRYFEHVLPTEVRRMLVLNRERILDGFVWQRDSTLLAHLRDADLAAHFTRAIESCAKAGSAGVSHMAQASPMVVRSMRRPKHDSLPAASASAGAGAASAGSVASPAGGGGNSSAKPLFAGGLAALLGAGLLPSP